MSHQNRPKSARVRLIQRLSHWFDQHSVPESAVIMLSALIVGAGAGLAAVAFWRLIGGVRTLAYGGLGGLLGSIAPFHLLNIPAVGGLLVHYLAHETKGSGMPEIIESVALRGGRIRPRVIIVKALTAAICIGTGGSAGREGPIAHIGSALGSTLGQLLKLSDERIHSLLACGAAGAVAATFNSPIAGSLFALEVILGRFHATHFGAVVMSAVTADVMAHIFEGDLRAFSIPVYRLVSPWKLALYTLLGLAAAVISAGFGRMLYLSADFWDALRLPNHLKLALGGILLGVIGIFTLQVDGFPRVFGVGYPSITEALSNRLALNVIVALFFLKMLATVLTLGSGGSGGVFAPSLSVGANCTWRAATRRCRPKTR